MIPVLDRITYYREQKGWSEYQLATKSGLTQSTISSWYRKDLLPSIPSLEKICTAFGITFSQFFSEREIPYALTDVQKQLLEVSTSLTEEQQLALIELSVKHLQQFLDDVVKQFFFSPMKNYSLSVHGTKFSLATNNLPKN